MAQKEDVHLNDYRTEFVNMCQNLLKSAKFQTLTTSLLILQSAISQHLVDNPIYIKNYSNKNLLFFHLAVHLFIYLF